MITRYGTPKKSPLPIIMKSGLLAGTGRASVSCCATPVSSMPMPSVMMNGSVFCCTTRKPLMKPTKAPKASAQRIAAHIGITSSSLMAMMPATTRMPPIDRSQPPLMTVSVTPKARISRIDVEFSISSRLNAV